MLLMESTNKLDALLHPTPIQLPARTSILLDKMYPTIPWKEVTSYNGLPWFMSKTSAIGTAQPSHFIKTSLGIYFKDFEGLSPNSQKSVLIHEAYHIQQYYDLKTSFDWGFYNKFMRLYFAWNLQLFFESFFVKRIGWKAAQYHAYRQHPMEIAAYDHEADFHAQINHFNAHEVGVFLRQFPRLIVRQSQPIERPNLFFYGLGTLITLMIAISRPVIESILIVVAKVTRI